MLLFKEAETLYGKQLHQILASFSRKCNTIFVFVSDSFHSRIESALTILYYTPLPNMEGEFQVYQWVKKN